jgi:hypothetical protein
MTAIMYRPRTRAEVVRLLAEREEIEEMRTAYAAWDGGAEPVEGEPIRLVDRIIIGLVMAMGCATWLAIIARLARGVWWR